MLIFGKLSVHLSISYFVLLYIFFWFNTNYHWLYWLSGHTDAWGSESKLPPPQQPVLPIQRGWELGFFGNSQKCLFHSIHYEDLMRSCMPNKYSHKHLISCSYTFLGACGDLPGSPSLCFSAHTPTPLIPSLNQSLTFCSILQKCQQHRLCILVAETSLKI